MVIRDVEPDRLPLQRFLEVIGLAGFDPLSAHEDPALVADEAVAVLAVTGGDQVDAIGVGVGDSEVRVAIVAVGLVRGLGAGGRDVHRARPVHTEGPLGDVVVVGAPVGELAAAILVPPSKFVMTSFLDVRDVGCRTFPEIPVEPFGYRCSS